MTTAESNEHQKAVDKALCDLDDFINQPPSYEDKKRVREYRHELYPKFGKLVLAMSVNSCNAHDGIVERAYEQADKVIRERYPDKEELVFALDGLSCFNTALLKSKE